MPWMRLDDRMAFHVKVLAAGNEAVGAWARAGAWSSGEGTDGHIPATTARTIATPRVWKKLCEVALAHEVDGGFEIHDFLDYNPRSEKAAAKRVARAEAGRKGGLTKHANLRNQTSALANEEAKPLAIASHFAWQSSQQTGKQNPTPIPIPIPDPPVAPPSEPSPTSAGPAHEPPSAAGADRPLGTRVRTSIDRFEEPFWKAAYADTVRAVLGKSWAFPDKQISGLRSAVVEHCHDPDRDCWLRREVSRFIRATQTRPTLWSSFGPDGFLKWLNGGASDQPDERPASGHHVTASPAAYHAMAPKNPIAPPRNHPAHAHDPPPKPPTNPPPPEVHS